MFYLEDTGILLV